MADSSDTSSPPLPFSGFTKGATITPECEVLTEGEGDSLESLHQNCLKNPGHKNFIPVSEFTMEHLPVERQTQEMMDYIKARCNLTVRVVVRFTSKNRPDKFSDCDAPYPYSQFKGSRRKVRHGTGFIIHVSPVQDSVKGQPCPCHLCGNSDQPVTEYWRAIVRTATHVVYDDSEVVRTVFDCFYDSDEDKDNLKSLYGHKVLKYTSKPAMDTYLSDLCHIECFTHDRELVEKLHTWPDALKSEFAIPNYDVPLGILISHPHGCSKRITLGKVFHLTYPLHKNYPDNVEATRCRLPLFPWSMNSEDFLQNFGDDGHKMSDQFSPWPGKEFALPDDMVITIPDDPGFALRYHYHQPNWFILPPGTKFTLVDGTKVSFPPEAEFFDNGSVSGCCYITYDVPSCPGSSGANIIHDLGRHQFRINFPHMGSINGIVNKSGLHYYDLLIRL